MNPAILLALTGAAISTGNDLVYRKASMHGRDRGPFPFTFLASVTSSLVAFLFMLAQSGRNGGVFIGSKDLVFGTVLGILSFMTYLLYLSSFTGENTSVSVTIYRMNLVPGILLAVLFMGETISLLRGTAILLCIGSVLLLGTWRAVGPIDRRSLWRSLGAFLTGGIMNVANKFAISNGGDSFRILFVRFLVVAFLAALAMLLLGTFRFDRRTVLFAGMSGLLLLLSIYFILEALKTGDVGLVLPITQLSFPFIAVISWIFLKERASITKVLGIILAIGSVLLMR